MPLPSRPSPARSRLVRLVLLGALLAVAAAAPAAANEPTAAPPHGPAAAPAPAGEYVCPMSEHTQVFARPGVCPLCGMQLVARAPTAASAADTSAAGALDGSVLPPLPDAGPPYVCPMDGHTALYDHPGSCPLCRMRLVSRRTLRPPSAAILIFDGAAALDWTGPYEVLGRAGFRVFTVAAEKRPVTLALDAKVMPDFPFGTAPAADVLVIPGGTLRLDDRRIVDWLRARADHTAALLAVSNGVFWLARAGLLDGLEVTTFPGLLDALRAASPKARVVAGRRSVDSGQVLTGEGAAAGQDGALRIVERLLGGDRARDVAHELAIDWRPEPAPPAKPRAPGSRPRAQR